MVDQHIPALWRTDNLRPGIFIQYLRYGTRMVLFGMVGYYIVNIPDSELIKVINQDIVHRRVYAVYERRLFTPLYQVSVIACPVR